MNKQRVLLAMSSGVDSSVAAGLLMEQGYTVVGLTLVTWDYELIRQQPIKDKPDGWQIAHEATRLAQQMGIEHYIVDVRQAFANVIIRYLTDSYLNSQTPSPCIECNSLIKFATLEQKANELNCYYIATGHYARVRTENGRTVLYRGVDEWKDQSFMLWRLSQSKLARCLFPVGNYSKEAIKNRAAQQGYHDLSAKRESYNLCFIPDDNYRGLLNRFHPQLSQQLAKGEIYTTDGRFAGRHEGYPYYTVGQSNGLPRFENQKWYVNRIEADKNQLIISDKKSIYHTQATITDLVFHKYAALTGQGRYIVCVRGKDAGTPATVSADGEKLRIEFDQPVFSIAPGQSMVIYEGNEVVCGGVVIVDK